MPHAQFSESMFVVVRQDADAQWMPVVFHGAVVLFNDGEKANRFVRTVKGLPEGCKVSRESGWERVIGVLELGARAGADGVIVDPADTGKKHPVTDAIASLRGMMTDVAQASAARFARAIRRHVPVVSGQFDPSAARGLLARLAETHQPPADVRDSLDITDEHLRSAASGLRSLSWGGGDCKVFVPDVDLNRVVDWLDDLPPEGEAPGG